MVFYGHILLDMDDVYYYCGMYGLKTCIMVGYRSDYDYVMVQNIAVSKFVALPQTLTVLVFVSQLADLEMVMVLWRQDSQNMTRFSQN